MAPNAIAVHPVNHAENPENKDRFQGGIRHNNGTAQVAANQTRAAVCRDRRAFAPHPHAQHARPLQKSTHARTGRVVAQEEPL